MLQSASIDRSVRILRPLTLDFVVVDHWMRSACATLDPRAEEYVKQYMEVALACCSDQSTRLDLVIMNAMSVLMGRFLDDSAPDFLPENLPFDPSNVPDELRAFRSLRTGTLVSAST